MDGCGKSRTTGIRSPDRAARSMSLYRLSYPGPVVIIPVINVWGCGGMAPCKLSDQFDFSYI